MYVYVNPTTGTVDAIDSDTFILDTGLDTPHITTVAEATQEVDINHHSVFPLLESLEALDDDGGHRALVPPSKVDELIESTARECARIYLEQTAGDFTWNGVLFYFLVSLRAAGANI